MVGNKVNRIGAAVLALVLLSGLCHAQSVDAEYSRERYDVIVERSPFGADPLTDAEVADKEAAKTLQVLEKELRLCFLLKSQSGEVRAGFQNIKAQKGEPKSVMLMVGESFRAMKLLDIDLENSSATLQYQGKPVTFELTKGTQAKAVPAAATPQRPTTQPQRRFGSGFRRTTQPEEQAQPTPPQPQKPPEPELSPEEQEQRQAEVRENLRQYQMEVIRAGMPPLPIPLTKEMDDQLVAEGVLPPAEEDQ